MKKAADKTISKFQSRDFRNSDLSHKTKEILVRDLVLQQNCRLDNLEDLNELNEIDENDLFKEIEDDQSSYKKQLTRPHYIIKNPK